MRCNAIRCDTIHNRARVTPAGRPVKNVEINDDPCIRVLPARGVERFRRRDSLDLSTPIVYRRSRLQSQSACRPREELVDESWNREGPARGSEKSRLPLTSVGCWCEYSIKIQHPVINLVFRKSLCSTVRGNDIKWNDTIFGLRGIPQNDLSTHRRVASGEKRMRMWERREEMNVWSKKQLWGITKVL